MSATDSAAWSSNGQIWSCWETFTWTDREKAGRCQAGGQGQHSGIFSLLHTKTEVSLEKSLTGTETQRYFIRQSAHSNCWDSCSLKEEFHFCEVRLIKAKRMLICPLERVTVRFPFLVSDHVCDSSNPSWSSVLNIFKEKLLSFLNVVITYWSHGDQSESDLCESNSRKQQEVRSALKGRSAIQHERNKRFIPSSLRNTFKRFKANIYLDVITCEGEWLRPLWRSKQEVDFYSSDALQK